MSEMVGPRDSFGKALLAVAQDNPNVVALCADLMESIRLEEFKKTFPKQFFEMGVAEQNMMGVGAGMALSGLIPFVCSFAVFNPGRNWDQLRVSVCYSNANVKIIGAHAGLSVGPDGATHQALEDIAITRALPNLVVIVPTDGAETEAVVRAAIAHEGPVYIRFGRDAVPQITNRKKFEIGKAYVMREGTDLTICACGPMVATALEIAEQSKASIEVIAVPTIKPLDHKTILASVRKTKAVVTAEDAQVTGGLGGAIAELLAAEEPLPLERVGVQDSFGQSGTTAELYAHYGLDAAAMTKAVGRCLLRKSK